MEEVLLNNGVVLLPYENKKGEVKSGIITGIDTKAIKSDLIELGCVWNRYIINPDIKKPGVWLFSEKKLIDVIAYFENKEKLRKGNIELPVLDKQVGKKAKVIVINSFSFLFEYNKVKCNDVFSFDINGNIVTIYHSFDRLNSEVKRIIVSIVYTHIQNMGNNNMKRLLNMINNNYLIIK